jgi:hypothetical protein
MATTKTNNDCRAQVVNKFQLFCTCVLLVSASGCIFYVQVPATGKRVAWGNKIELKDLTFVQLGETTRHELEFRLGAPWTNYTDLRVSVYYWEIVTGYRTYGLGFDVGGKVVSETVNRMDLLFIEFSQEDKVKRFETMRHPKRIGTKEAATEWQASK